MGLRTSRPLLSEDGDSENLGEGENYHDITEDSDNATESCWRYLIRKLYYILGYQELNLNDINRQSKRKREDHNIDDDKDLLDENQPSQKMAKLDELLQEIVIVEEEDKPVPIPPASTSDATKTKEEVDRPLDYLDYNFLNDPDTISLLSSSLTMVVMRGLPGSGKSTVVSAISRLYPRAVVCSADHYFLRDGRYEFDPALLKSAHQECQDKARAACEAGERLVVVDNTGVRRWELVTYFKLAQSYNYTVIVVEPRTPWRFNVNQLAAKNTHGVQRLAIIHLVMRSNNWILW